VSNNALDYLRQEIAKTVENTAHHISRGSIANYEEYKRLCGFIQGLEAASHLIGDLAKRLETDADE
jgi:hypothetical protein